MKECPIVIKLQNRIADLEEVMNRGPVPKRMSCADIIKATADYYNMDPLTLRQRGKKIDVCLPRMIAIYICRRTTNLSLAGIGQQFGGKHYTTVLYACRRINAARNGYWISSAIAAITKSAEGNVHIRSANPNDSVLLATREMDAGGKRKENAKRNN
jgi:hypothetical protein